MKIPKRNADGADLSAVEVRRSDVHGRGVFALRNLRAGEVIGHYAGRRYGPDNTHPGWNDQLTYLFGLSDGSVIDGTQGGNATRHINHACVPNVEAVERLPAGLHDHDLAAIAFKFIDCFEFMLGQAIRLELVDAESSGN